MFKRIPWKSHLPAYLPSTNLAEAVFIGIGCNIGSAGQRRRIISLALKKIASIHETRILAISSLYNTPPWGVREQDNFTNAVVAIRCPLAPKDLLRMLKRIELQLGRKLRIRWGAREIDLDILIARNITMRGEELTVPHPQLCNREFALVPLREIAPGIVISNKCNRYLGIS